jgi:predicted DNA-binding transcriptional regulator YafY
LFIIEAMKIRNRIVGHRRVRAGDLIPHELNWRVHPPAQRRALRALYREVGFARSLLAFERPDGRLQLIDGHLRREIDPDMLVDVEILDVTPDEARKLLLSMDSLAALADANAAALTELRKLTATDSPALAGLWQSLAEGNRATDEALAPPPTPAEQFLILIQCRDEQHQVELLGKLQADGIPCKALVS